MAKDLHSRIVEENKRKGIVPMLTQQPSRYHKCGSCGVNINPQLQGSRGGWSEVEPGVFDCVYYHAPVCPSPNEEEGSALDGV